MAVIGSVVLAASACEQRARGAGELADDALLVAMPPELVETNRLLTPAQDVIGENDNSVVVDYKSVSDPRATIKLFLKKAVDAGWEIRSAQGCQPDYPSATSPSSLRGSADR